MKDRYILYGDNGGWDAWEYHYNTKAAVRRKAIQILSAGYEVYFADLKLKTTQELKLNSAHILPKF